MLVAVFVEVVRCAGEGLLFFLEGSGDRIVHYDFDYFVDLGFRLEV